MANNTPPAFLIPPRLGTCPNGKAQRPGRAQFWWLRGRASEQPTAAPVEIPPPHEHRMVSQNALAVAVASLLIRAVLFDADQLAPPIALLLALLVMIFSVLSALLCI